MSGYPTSGANAGGIVLVGSLSVIREDGRILRQIRSILAAGFRVVAFGASAGPGCPSPDWPGFSLVEFDLPEWSLGMKLRTTLHFGMGGFLDRTGQADLGAGAFRGVIRLRETMRDWTLAHGAADVVLAIAHDWAALPAAVALKQQFGIPFHYDSHEFATEEFSGNRLWRLAYPRTIRRVERRGVEMARSVSAPSIGICEALRTTYRASGTIGVVRNAYEGDPLPARTTGALVQVLYHGIFREDRGLLEMLDDLPNWPAPFSLVLRGHATNRRFGERIEAITKLLNGRVTLQPMVPQDRILHEAARADIGVFLPPLESPQLRHALPNKLFEYLHAGLMVIVPDDCEMGEVVRATGAGLTINPRKTSLASVLGSLSASDIDAFKAAAHRAAITMGWAQEEKAFLALVGLRPGAEGASATGF